MRRFPQIVDKKIDRRVSVAAQIFEITRDEIITGALEPGSPLSENALSKRFGVSRTPIREALLRLAEEELVQIIPQVGTYVTKISLRNVRDAHFIREALECAIIREAAQNATSSDLALFDGIIVDQKLAAKKGEHNDFYLADEALHAAFARASGFQRAWAVASAEKVQLDRVRLLDVSRRENLAELVDQHVAIVEAVRTGNQANAVMAMQVHLRDVFNRLQPLISKHGNYFVDDDVCSSETQQG